VKFDKSRSSERFSIGAALGRGGAKVKKVDASSQGRGKVEEKKIRRGWLKGEGKESVPRQVERNAAGGRSKLRNRNGTLSKIRMG